MMRTTLKKGAEFEDAAKRRKDRSNALVFASVGLGATGLLGFVFARRLLKRT